MVFCEKDAEEDDDETGERSNPCLDLLCFDVCVDFFTSAFVIRFIVDAEMEKQQIIMHRIFSYLDTCADWQFSLFEYSEVTAVKVEKIQNSCVYQKEV